MLILCECENKPVQNLAMSIEGWSSRGKQRAMYHVDVRQGRTLDRVVLGFWSAKCSADVEHLQYFSTHAPVLRGSEAVGKVSPRLICIFMMVRTCAHVRIDTQKTSGQDEMG